MIIKKFPITANTFSNEINILISEFSELAKQIVYLWSSMGWQIPICHSRIGIRLPIFILIQMKINLSGGIHALDKKPIVHHHWFGMQF